MVEDVHSRLGSRVVGSSARQVGSGLQAGGSTRRRYMVREHQQRPEEDVCHREWNLEVQADIDGTRAVVVQELAREERWPEDCKWVGSAMTSSWKHPGPYERHRWVGGERALPGQGRSQAGERPVG